MHHLNAAHDMNATVKEELLHATILAASLAGMPDLSAVLRAISMFLPETILRSHSRYLYNSVEFTSRAACGSPTGQTCAKPLEGLLTSSWAD